MLIEGEPTSQQCEFLLQCSTSNVIQHGTTAHACICLVMDASQTCYMPTLHENVGVVDSNDWPYLWACAYVVYWLLALVQATLHIPTSWQAGKRCVTYIMRYPTACWPYSLKYDWNQGLWCLRTSIRNVTADFLRCCDITVLLLMSFQTVSIFWWSFQGRWVWCYG